ncbi:MAG: DNA translocase FtsK [Clostridium lundense]|nr:DNA translocase FtsK [Clostridium lundense]
MNRYRFVDLTPVQKNANYAAASVGALTLLLGATGSLAACNGAIIASGAVAYAVIKNKSLSFNRVIKRKLYNLIKTHGFYKEEGKKLIYRPQVQYEFDEKYLIIGFKLDGSVFRDNYLELENYLQDLFLMECISKEQTEGFIYYKLDRTSTERLNMSEIQFLEDDLIPINSKIYWNFRKCPHALITGGTGKGKTYLLAYIIKIFLLLKADIKILDPKMSDLSYLERFLKENVASSPGQIAKTLKEVVKKMNERYEQFKVWHNYGFGKDYKDYGYKPVVIIFDEVAAFVASIDKKLGKEIDDYMSEIILKGRQAGIFMILTTQRPDADVIKTAIRDQLGLRVALGEMSKTGYTMVFGSEFNDLELNNNAPGNGYIMIDGVHTKPIKFQSPYFDKDYNFVKDITTIVRQG